jgi:hypothetical protein
MPIEQGNFVEIRGRPWLVEAVNDAQPDLTTVKLSCIADDAQGEQIEVLWDAEIGASVLEEDAWSQVGRGAPDSPEVLAAYVKAIRWRSATAAVKLSGNFLIAVVIESQSPQGQHLRRLS